MSTGPAQRASVVRLLLVDDVTEILDVFRRLVGRLSRPGLDLQTAADPREAARRLEEERFDVVVCDYGMPHIDGGALLRLARRTQPQARLAIITGYNELPESRDDLQAARVDAYLKKPISAAELLEVLRAFVGDDDAALDRYRAQARARETEAKGE